MSEESARLVAMLNALAWWIFACGLLAFVMTEIVYHIRAAIWARRRIGSLSSENLRAALKDKGTNDA
ncbi:hypothetical protein [Methylosinus sp. LW4]|uniref:hypothetical protein n=1 Tax=Methylosinus sp. LW4 TaxID=136993 RepID=UPI00036F378B|nr:hypothetical protein [Methylosinus sp. LW4]